MEKIAELERELDMHLMRGHDKVCGQVHAKERARISERWAN